jgi:hypothetical protein
MVGVTGGIMTMGIMADGVTVADGVMTDTTLLAVTADLVTVADSEGMVADSKGMAVAGLRDMAVEDLGDMAEEEAIAAEPNGHRISRTIV